MIATSTVCVAVYRSGFFMMVAIGNGLRQLRAVLRLPARHWRVTLAPHPPPRA